MHRGPSEERSSWEGHFLSRPQAACPHSKGSGVRAVCSNTEQCERSRLGLPQKPPFCSCIGWPVNDDTIGIKGFDSSKGKFKWVKLKFYPFCESTPGSLEALVTFSNLSNCFTEGRNFPRWTSRVSTDSIVPVLCHLQQTTALMLLDSSTSMWPCTKSAQTRPLSEILLRPRNPRTVGLWVRECTSDNNNKAKWVANGLHFPFWVSYPFKLSINCENCTENSGLWAEACLSRRPLSVQIQQVSAWFIIKRYFTLLHRHFEFIIQISSLWENKYCTVLGRECIKTNVLSAQNVNHYLNLITLIHDVVNVIHFTEYFKQFGSGDITGI